MVPLNDYNNLKKMHIDLLSKRILRKCLKCLLKTQNVKGLPSYVSIERERKTIHII